MEKFLLIGDLAGEHPKALASARHEHPLWRGCLGSSPIVHTMQLNKFKCQRNIFKDFFP